MTVSITAARLFAEAFRRGDFTGWPDFVRMDDGQYMSQLILSVSKRKVIYSVIARTEDPKGRVFVFVLCIDQAAKGMESYHNKVGVMNAALSAKDGEPKLVIGLDYGEYLVLDAVEQPALRSLEEARASYQASVADIARTAHRSIDLGDPGDGGYDDEDEGDDDGYDEDEEDDGSSGSFFGNLKERAAMKSTRKSLVSRARSNMPPRDRMRFKRGR